jgi:hypothetical protein
MVDALASGASVRMDVEVRVLFWAPFNPEIYTIINNLPDLCVFLSTQLSTLSDNLLFSDIDEYMLNRPINNQLVRLGGFPKALKRRDNMIYQRTSPQLASLNEPSPWRQCRACIGDICDPKIEVLLANREAC